MDRKFLDCNWVLVQYRSRPAAGVVDPSDPDGRTDDQWFLIEESVPEDYRHDVESGKVSFELVSPQAPGLFLTLPWCRSRRASVCRFFDRPGRRRPRSPMPAPLPSAPMLRLRHSLSSLSTSLSLLRALAAPHAISPLTDRHHRPEARTEDLPDLQIFTSMRHSHLQLQRPSRLTAQFMVLCPGL